MDEHATPQTCETLNTLCTARICQSCPKPQSDAEETSPIKIGLEVGGIFGIPLDLDVGMASVSWRFETHLLRCLSCEAIKGHRQLLRWRQLREDIAILFLDLERGEIETWVGDAETSLQVVDAFVNWVCEGNSAIGFHAH